LAQVSGVDSWDRNVGDRRGKARYDVAAANDLENFIEPVKWQSSDDGHTLFTTERSEEDSTKSIQTRSPALAGAGPRANAYHSEKAGAPVGERYNA
jgi:hypothetical protein